MIETSVLTQVELFRGLNQVALHELRTRAIVRHFDPGDVLWTTGETARGLFVVVQGAVRVVGAADGRPYVIHTESAGGVLGDVPLFAGGGYPATAIAERRTTCVVLSRDVIAAAIRQDPELAFALLARLGARVRLLIGRLDGLTGRSVKARLAAYLLQRARTATVNGSFTLGCTQTALAEELGTVREVVVRALRELRTASIISVEARNRLRIRDSAALAELAGAPPSNPTPP